MNNFHYTDTQFQIRPNGTQATAKEPAENLTTTGTSPKVPILVVEDDQAIRRLLAAAFSDSEFRLVEAATFLQGLAAATKGRPEVILLDLNLPDFDGVEFVRRVRTWSQVPIIVVSAEGHEDRKVDALDAGADDYVTKPFGVAELMARVRSSWRRYQRSGLPTSEPNIEVGDVVINLDTRQVKKNDELIHLTPIEYNLLVLLAKHAGRVITQRQLLTTVWGEEYSEESQYLRIYIGYLRKKLEDDPANPKLVITEPRVGYRIQG
ncbi:MAG: KDP operon transcriptional regulatory protein KdpE [Fimbriimonadaceae bacterium]|nr:KDP operon transcriptional regulatory protein KdpE [Fimbriimonadaceae bacterium]